MNALMKDCTIVMKEQFVMIQMEASTVHVLMALKEMEPFVMVR